MAVKLDKFRDQDDMCSANPSVIEHFQKKLSRAFSNEHQLSYDFEFVDSDTGISGSLVVKTTFSKQKQLSEGQFDHLRSVEEVDDWLANFLSIMLMSHAKWYK